MKQHEEDEDEEGEEEKRKKVSEFVKKLEAKSKKTKYTQSKIDFSTLTVKEKKTCK